MIRSYSFGHMTIDGKDFSKDLLILPDGSVISPWWRKSGHLLCLDDIEKLIHAGPEIIIAGCGSSHTMKTELGLEEILSGKGIILIAEPSAKAMELYNDLSARHSVGAGFHLTC